MKSVSILSFEKHVASLPFSFVDWVCTYARVFFCVAKEGDELAFFIAGVLFVLTPLEKRPKYFSQGQQSSPSSKSAFFDFFTKDFRSQNWWQRCVSTNSIGFVLFQTLTYLKE